VRGVLDVLGPQTTLIEGIPGGIDTGNVGKVELTYYS
jgi:hypothetical protein